MYTPHLMRKYPTTFRANIIEQRLKVSESDRVIARKFDKRYFDSERRFGYGGYSYDPKFFANVVKDFIYHYELGVGDKVLDVGCAKGFMLFDFVKKLPGLDVRGIDISNYALDTALPNLKKYLDHGCCSKLPYEDNSFDLVISISTIHNLDLDGVRLALREITRVSRGKSFVKVNGYRNLVEREALEKWNLVAKTILHEEEWKELFFEVGYTGDYDFFKA